MKTILTSILVALVVLVAFVERLKAKEVLFAGTSNGRLERFDLSGASLGGFPILTPNSIAVDNKGTVFMTPLAPSPTILWYDTSGTPLGVFAQATPHPTDNESTFPLGLAFDASGILHLGVNAINDRVERFGPDGTSLGTFPTDPQGAPLSLTFDHAGNLYLPNFEKISRYASDGTPLGNFASVSHGNAWDMAFDSSDNLYVGLLETSPSTVFTVEVFDSSGAFLRSIPVGVDEVHSIAIDSNDVLYVGGLENIRRYLADGTPLGVFAEISSPPGFGYGFSALTIVNVVPEPSSAIIALIAWLGVIPAIRQPLRQRIQQSLF